MPVVNLEITRREPYEEGRPFGDAGPYERIDGVVTFAVDPTHEVNEPIVDLDLAPRDELRRVRFRSDFSLLQPQDGATGNGRLFVDVVNRGRRRVNYLFNRAPNNPPAPGVVDPGDGFLFRHGYSVVSIGWQWDVPRSADLLGLEAPRAEIEGRPVRGQTVVEIRPNAFDRTRLLANRIHEPYRVADLDDSGARLLVRDYEDGEDEEIPRDRWRFAQETDEGVVPSDVHVYLDGGFEPGRIYNVVYTTEDAPVVGTGLLALREIASFLREPSELNPAQGGFEKVYGFGVSQTGRMLRHLVYLGLNVSEEGRQAYDGLMPHVAGGRRGEFNHRFAQPSAQSVPGFGHRFPFADNEAVDPYSEARAGLFDRLRKLDALPKVLYTNSSAEYWRGDGSLAHIDPSGEQDMPPASNAKHYLFSSTEHIPGSLPYARHDAPDGPGGRNAANVVDYRPLLRAALVNLDRWVTTGKEPGPSRHPRLDEGTAVTRADVLASLDMVPGLERPDPERLWVIRTVDMGPEGERGVGEYPVREGETYPCFVSAVDADGNEVAGIRLPDVTVPVGTHLGWNTRHPDAGAPEQIVSMQGSTIFFAATRVQREAVGDPRPSLEERYESREAYVEQARAAAQSLVSGRYLIEEDVDIVVEAAAARYDAALAAANASVAAAGGS